MAASTAPANSTTLTGTTTDDGHGRQATEVAIAVGVLNRMLELGRPESVRIA